MVRAITPSSPSSGRFDQIVNSFAKNVPLSCSEEIFGVMDTCYALDRPDSAHLVATTIARSLYRAFKPPQKIYTGPYIKYQVVRSETAGTSVECSRSHREIIAELIPKIRYRAALRADAETIQPTLSVLMYGWMQLQNYGVEDALRQPPPAFSIAMKNIQNEWAQVCTCCCCACLREFLIDDPFEAVLYLTSIPPELRACTLKMLERYVPQEVGEWIAMKNAILVGGRGTILEVDVH